MFLILFTQINDMNESESEISHTEIIVENAIWNIIYV